MVKIEYPIPKLGTWSEFLKNKIFGATISSGLLFFSQFILVYLYLNTEEKKELIVPLIKGIVNGSFFFLILGFAVATARSLYKGCRDIKMKREEPKKVIKDPRDMCWTYYVNYPIILTLIYVLGAHFLRQQPLYVYWTILFGLGFYVDIVFEKIVSLIP